VREIYLWWIGHEAADPRTLGAARVGLEEAFRLRVRLWHREDRPTDAFDARRQQYSSSRILRWLLDRRPSGADRLLGVTDVDLFIPVLTFVFGEAQLGGHAALVSTARLREGHEPPDVVRRRIVKECVHEVGHTFGLLHCSDVRCVMSRSVSVLNVDTKDGELCEDCRTRFRQTHGENARDE
jgi:archaemetzincin